MDIPLNSSKPSTSVVPINSDSRSEEERDIPSSKKPCISTVESEHIKKQSKYHTTSRVAGNTRKGEKKICRCMETTRKKGSSLDSIIEHTYIIIQYTKYYAHCKFTWSFPSNISLNLKGGRILLRRGEAPPLNETLKIHYNMRSYPSYISWIKSSHLIFHSHIIFSHHVVYIHYIYT